MGLANNRQLRSMLLVVPPPGGTPQSAWLGIDRLASGAMTDTAHAGMMGGAGIPGLDPTLQKQLSADWRKVQTAWSARDAAGAGEALNRLAAGLARIEPRLYPERSRLALEHWYYKYSKLMGVWFLYALGFVILLAAFLGRHNTARRAGVLVFVIAFALHTVSIGVRWFLAGRVPIANMFEAVTGAAWLGAAAALVLEVWLRRSPMRNLFATGASFFAMLALGAGYFMPVTLNSNISNTMPILNTVWLQIHVSLIIFGYAMIAVAFVTAVLYLSLRLVGTAEYDRYGEYRGVLAHRSRLVQMTDVPAHRRGPAFFVGAAVAVAMAIVLALLLRGEIAGALSKVLAPAGTGSAIAHALYAVLLVAVVVLGPPFVIWLLVGTALIILGRDHAAESIRDVPRGLVLDGATMILIEAAFVTLWVGIVLGAGWADVSWGRPWGWDPKEVFALNTWLIFVGLIHIRLNVRDKGLWTAVLAVAGFLVMMFNWIGVNYFIIGLHSYA